MKVPEEVRSDMEDHVLFLFSNKSSETDFEQLYKDPVFNYLFHRSSIVALVYHFTSRSFKFVSKNVHLLTGRNSSSLNKLSLIEFTNHLFEENTANLLYKIIYPKILKYYKEYTLNGNIKDLKITITSKIKTSSAGWIMLHMNILETDQNGFPVTSVLFMSSINEIKNNSLIDFAIYKKDHLKKSYVILYTISYPSEKSIYNLSPREYEIVSYIRQGKSSKEIASILQLSVYTIETHRRKILKKTGTPNMTALVRQFIVQEGM